MHLVALALPALIRQAYHGLLSMGPSIRTNLIFWTHYGWWRLSGQAFFCGVLCGINYGCSHRGHPGGL